MIRYALKCGQGHRFESWFQSSAAYDKLAKAGMLNCAVCGDADISKTIMAPRVTTGRKKEETVPQALADHMQENAQQPESTPAAPKASAAASSDDMTASSAAEPAADNGATVDLRSPSNPLEAALQKLRETVMRDGEDMGTQFAQEARAIHAGEADDRLIYGEATGDDIKELHDEGINVAPLPIITRRDS